MFELYFPPTNLSYAADASGGKPGQHHDCSCTHLPAGGGPNIVLQPEWPTSGPPRGAGDRIVTEPRVQHRPGPTVRSVMDDQEPLGRSRGSDWPGQNLPGEGETISDGEET